VLAQYSGEAPSLDASLSPSAVTGSVQAAADGLNTSSLAFNAGDSATPAFDVGETQRSDAFATSFMFGNDRGYGNLPGTGVTSGRGTSGVLNSLFASGASPFTPSSIGFGAYNAGALKFELSTGATALLALGVIAGLMRSRQRRSGHHKLHLNYHL
jgi:hypothetical protein